VDESNERLPAAGFLLFAIMATMAFLRWNDRRSRRRMPRFQKDSGPARKYLHEHEVFRGKVENHKQHDPVAEPDISVDEQDAPFWDLDTIRRLPHRQFEILCQRLFEAMGAQVEINDGGSPDGGIDLKIFKNGKLEAIVQCKQYPRKKIGVNLIREFFGVMTSESAPEGIFITSSDFTESAKEFAATNRIMLADGPALEKKLLRHNVLRGSEFSPNAPGEVACPLCNAPMVWRESGNFWGCSTFGATRCSGKRYKAAAG
jgi:restriction endonuclease Mrr